MNEFHEANRKGWNAAARAGLGQVDKERNWQHCFRDATQILEPKELKWLGDVKGQEVCVLGSGDNLVVFALAGLGANVTSVDISEEQLSIASKRALELGVSIRFVRADVTDLTNIDTNTFDVVYTGGHVAVWVSDLWKYYREAVRILKPGGLFLINEYHPFRRVWKQKSGPLALDFGYFERGPHQWDKAKDIPGAEPGSLPTYEFHWTICEFLTAVVEAGAELVKVEEFGDEPESWEIASLAGLPRCLMIVSRKKGMKPISLNQAI